jgi:RHS repeat-associated protein
MVPDTFFLCLGTPRLVVNDAGGIICNHDYYPFGQERTICNDGETHKFTGQERDAESGLDYFGARHYASNLGRFTAVDPSRKSVNSSDPQSWNRYTYTLNKPLQYVDRNGKWPTDTHNRIIDRAFPGLSQQRRDALKQTSRWVDRPAGQTKAHNYEHALRSPGEDPAAARRAIDANIKGHQRAAQRAQGETPPSQVNQITPGALNEFGQALHTVTDRTSPAHTDANGNPMEWAGIPVTPAEVAAASQHAAEEANITAEQMDAAVKAARESFREAFGDVALQEAVSEPQPEEAAKEKK